MKDIFRITSISQFHEILRIPPPEHPLITLITDQDAAPKAEMDESMFNIRFSADMYAIMYKDKISGSLGYGRSSYDFQEGTLIFSSPGQVFTSPAKGELREKEGWTLLFHPDLLHGSDLGEAIDNYSYFSYESNEALHLSPKEERFIADVVGQIQEEYSQNLDKHSHKLIISNLELLLNYCMRFYDRQFITRASLNQDLLTKFESKLKKYFNSELILDQGLPSAAYFGEQMSMSPNYLSDLLKKETGNSIKEHIDAYVISKAKSTLLGTNQSISEIAFGLGFEYPQSFSRLFKKKTGVSPIEYRSLN